MNSRTSCFGASTGNVNDAPSSHSEARRLHQAFTVLLTREASSLEGSGVSLRARSGRERLPPPARQAWREASRASRGRPSPGTGSAPCIGQSPPRAFWPVSPDAHPGLAFCIRTATRRHTLNAFLPQAPHLGHLSSPRLPGEPFPFLGARRGINLSH